MERKNRSNRLIHEKSAYLRQHAYNPVDWFPWGEEAFEMAKRLEKPIFLSIGYATCHWCHVMEKESFSNPDIAKWINDVCVPIKVDREELPEVDFTYMQFAQALMNQAGGWPLNVILTPDLKPFAAVTYLPPEPKMGLISVVDFLKEVQKIWIDERDEIIAESQHLLEIVQSHHSSSREKDKIPDLNLVLEDLFKHLDPVHGGMNGAPKFPMGYHLTTLLAYFSRTEEMRAMYYVQKTLSEILKGGIHDHLGGGFSRYTVDENWIVPHFEKMLYDNAYLASSFIDAWKLCKDALYEEAVSETLEYIRKELTLEGGGFSSGEDADSEGEEGRFYTWSYEELQDALDPVAFNLAQEYYAFSDEGNFHGCNILHTPLTVKELAEKKGCNFEELEKQLKNIKEILCIERSRRERPIKDSKLITGWNALVADVFIRAGQSFHNQKWLEVGKDTLEFLLQHLYRDGLLFRRYCEGEARFPAILDDYAALVKALITAFEAEGNYAHLEMALQLSKAMRLDFKGSNGAFFQTKESDAVLIRNISLIDESEPSGNAVHLTNLIKLYDMTHDQIHLDQAEDILCASYPFVTNYPHACTYLIRGLDSYFYPKRAVAIVTLDEKESNKEDLKRVFSSLFLPHLSIVWKRMGDERAADVLPYLEEMHPLGGLTTIYICINGRCLPPLQEIDKVVEILQDL